jgi:hypothetical protein
MNLLSEVAWREHARQLLDGAGQGIVSARDLLVIVWQDYPISDAVDFDDLLHIERDDGGDSEMAAVLDVCHVAVVASTDFPEAEPDLDETAEDQPVTWMEAHGLEDGRQLMIPGEAGTLPTLSFWLRRSTDQRLGVVSFVLEANRQVTEISFRRSKACMETYDTTKRCDGLPGGCECVLRKRERRGVVRLRCRCQ